MSKPSFKQKTVSGLKWNSINRGVLQLSGAIISIILARLLSPAEFGLVAMVTVLTNFGNLFVDFGFTSAIIQNKKSDSHHWSSVFWLNLATSVIIALSLTALSPLIAEFYDESALRIITIVIAWTFVFQSFNLVQSSLLKKKMDFKNITIIRIGAQLLGGAVGVICAVKGFSYWSLIIKIYVTILATNIGVWFISEWRPQFVLDRSAVRELLNFSLPLMGSQSMNYWTRNADNLMVGKVLGDSALGVYSRAYTLMLLPLSSISSVISSVMFPAYSQIQDDKPRIKRIYQQITRSIAYFTFPMMFGLCVTAEPFVAVLLGAKWMGVVPILQILAPLGAVQSISTLEGNIFLSQGATRLQFITGIISKTIMVSSMVVGLYLGGLEGIAWAYLISSTTMAFFLFHYMGKLIDLTVIEICLNLARTFTAAVIMAFAVLLLKEFVFTQLSQTVILIASVLSGVSIYAMLSYLFGLDELLKIRKIIKS